MLRCCIFCMINCEMSVVVFLLIFVLHLYRLGTSVLCNFVWSYLLDCLRFRFIYILEWLPYFLQSFCALIHCFFFHICHIYSCCFVAGSCGCHFLDLRGLLSFSFLFFAARSCNGCLIEQDECVLWCPLFFLFFFSCFVRLFFSLFYN